MSEEQVETIRRLLEAEQRSDHATALECLHPEVEFVPLRAGIEGAFHGHDGYERFRDDTWDHYERFEPDYELVDLGDRVLGFGVVHVRGRGSGVEAEVPSAGIFEFRDGKIVRWEDFGTKEKALEMAGVRDTSLDDMS